MTRPLDLVEDGRGESSAEIRLGVGKPIEIEAEAVRKSADA